MADTNTSFGSQFMQTASFPTQDDCWPPSLLQEAQVICPHCAHSLQSIIWTIVNANRDPLLEDLIYDGRLFRINCPFCNGRIDLEQSCLYIDPAHATCIVLASTAEWRHDAVQFLRSLANEHTSVGRSRKRIVATTPELREKVLALKAGLDDRVLEMLKVSLAGQARLQGFLAQGELGEVTFERVSLGGWLHFCISSLNSSMNLSVPRQEYEELAYWLEKSSIAEDQPLVTGQHWASVAIGQLGREGWSRLV